MLRSFSLKRLRTNRTIQVGSTLQVSEFDNPTDIITHCPSLAERFPFHLDAFLYRSPPNPDQAAICHKKFCDFLHKETDARVWTTREVLQQMSTSQLRNLVIDSSDCKFKVVPDLNVEKMQKKMMREYFNYSLSNLSKDHLIDLLLLHPSVTITVDKSSTGFSITEIPVSPLSNIVFTRDQQITTAKGVVFGRLAAPQRRFESFLMEAVYRQLGVAPLGRIKAPGVLEGGDFIPAGYDLAFIGVGQRTNFAAVRQLLREDLFGTKRVVVVENVRDDSSSTTHLDTIFSLIDRKICICLDRVAQDDSRFMRIAHEYVRKGPVYIEEAQMPFGKWLRNEGFTVVMATLEQRDERFISNLHLGRDANGKSKILAINRDVASTLQRHGFDGTVLYTDFSPIISMFGGVHSTTQVMRASNTLLPFKKEKDDEV